VGGGRHRQLIRRQLGVALHVGGGEDAAVLPRERDEPRHCVLERHHRGVSQIRPLLGILVEEGVQRTRVVVSAPEVPSQPVEPLHDVRPAAQVDLGDHTVAVDPEGAGTPGTEFPGERTLHD